MTEPVSFDFITDRELRQALDSDYAEMVRCADQAAWKAVHVLAGSLIESLLVDYLLSIDSQGEDFLSFSLGQLVAEAKKRGIISEKTADLSSAVKSFRNLIHPGRSKRLAETPDAEGAIVAQALVAMIVKEVADVRRRAFGLTAEQVANKVESDSSALGITAHLLGEVSDQELERLLIDVIPVRYLELQESLFTADGEVIDVSGLSKAYPSLFKDAFDAASREVKENVIAHHIDVLRTAPGPQVRMHEEQFFRGSYLGYVKKVSSRKLIFDHLMSRLKSEPSVELVDALDGIGAHLRADQVVLFVDRLTIIVLNQGGTLAQRAKHRLMAEAKLTLPERDPEIRDRLRSWLDAVDGSKHPEKVAMLKEIDDAYDFTDVEDLVDAEE